MRFDTLSVTRAGAVAQIRLGRAALGNPIDDAFLRELDAAAGEIQDDPSVVVVLLTAAGDHFSCGRASVDTGALAAIDAMAAPLPFRCLELMAQPVIAVIEGDAVGAGLELALACDVRIAAEDAMLSLPDVMIGTMPAGGATQRLPRLVGPARASEMILFGTPVGSARAAAWGLVNVALPKAEVRAAAERLASSIAERGPLALRYAKEAMLRGLDMPLEQALRYETDLTVILQTTRDRAEGVRAFVEKRPSAFDGT